MARNIKVSGKGAKADKGAKAAANKGAKGKGATAAETPVAAKAAESATVRKAYTHKGASPYAPFNGTAKGAFTMAALVVAGLAKMAGGKVTKGENPSIALFRAIVGDAPIGHHRKAGNIVGGALTESGVTFFAKRNEGGGKTYNTDTEIVDAMVAAMRKGGTVHIGTSAVTFDREVKVG